MSETATTARPSLDFGEALRKYSIVLILLAFVIVVSIITEGRFLQTQNLLNVVVQVAPIGIIGLGMMAAIITKGIDLSVGSTVALCAIPRWRRRRQPDRGLQDPAVRRHPWHDDRRTWLREHLQRWPADQQHRPQVQ